MAAAPWLLWEPRVCCFHICFRALSAGISPLRPRLQDRVGSLGLGGVPAHLQEEEGHWTRGQLCKEEASSALESGTCVMGGQPQLHVWRPRPRRPSPTSSGAGATEEPNFKLCFILVNSSVGSPGGQWGLQPSTEYAAGRQGFLHLNFPVG